MIPLLVMSVSLAAPDGCRAVEGNFITARDLAAAEPAFAAAPATAVFAFAPRPGVRRVAEPAELARFARAHGIEGTFEPVCFQRASSPPDPEAVAAAMRASLAAPQARIEILEISKFPAPAGRMVFPRESLVEPSAAAGAAVWNGYIEYEGGRFSIWAKARIAVPVKRVVAAANLRAGQILAESDVRLETAEDFPHRALPVGSVEEAVGRVTRRSLPAGAPIVPAALAEPNAVERGQTVAVEVHSGAALLKLEAKAENAGHRGDTISLRNVESGKVFRARIEGKGLVVLECLQPGRTE